ncbi:cheY-homologous receiver domain [Vibrio sp. B1FLJ16]|uniref:response regulator n=1 Tax=Vibrio sp. B1FLJ16 TaxID=2751178 RepID=UPI0015F67C04|nr:response regulator [Vibrio sp. B1FLJ16]CAD7821223.1 cheY-homologous receiver domain [Vibrio sp. B1FLJ16]CAE6945535.1 cheY-homologous receiver domain [Vibrio sp. B1FLJ16]
MSLNNRDLKVLIADDSRLVTNSISAMLKKIGVKDIKCVYKPLEVLNACKNDNFDLVICDYNFQTQLNGFQIMEELKYHKYLPAHTTFVFLTGENDLKIVRSIIDSEPDDYLLKPFSQEFFQTRLRSAMKRRASLVKIHEELSNANYEGAVTACDELLPLHPNYSTLIRRYKAYALVQSKQFARARDEYEQMLEEDNFDWIKTSLANTLIEAHEFDKAQEVLDSLQRKDDNPYYHDEMSRLAVEKDDLPRAIEHLKLSAMLLDAGAERELVIANLSLAKESYNDAVTYMKRYYEKNINTFRGGVLTKLNYVRCFLYRALLSPGTYNFDNMLAGLKPFIREIERSNELNTQSDLIAAHIALIRGDLKKAVTNVKQALKANDLTHFYDQYHLCVLLERCSYMKDVKILLPKARSAIAKEQHPSILRSQIHMFQSFEVRIQESQKEIAQIREHLVGQKTIAAAEISTHFDHYFKLHELLPNSARICLAIIKLASIRPFNYQGNYHILSKIEACHKVMESLCSKEQLGDMEYHSMYDKAKSNIRKVI